MNIPSSSINLDFNREFRDIYSILQTIDARAKTADKSDTKLAETVYKYAQTFTSFGLKYKKYNEVLTFEPETLALIPPDKLVGYVMNDLCDTAKRLTEFQTLEKELQSLLS